MRSASQPLSAVEAAHEVNISVGTLVIDVAEREAYLEWDIDYLVAAVDAVHLAEGATAALEDVRDRSGRVGSVVALEVSVLTDVTVGLAPTAAVRGSEKS